MTKHILGLTLAVAMTIASQTGHAASFDGVYVGDVPYGTPKTARARCLEAFPNTKLTVKDGVASMRWNGPLTGPVGPDGSLSLQGSNGISVVGSFAGSTFTGAISGTYCNFKATLTKS